MAMPRKAIKHWTCRTPNCESVTKRMKPVSSWGPPQLLRKNRIYYTLEEHLSRSLLSNLFCEPDNIIKGIQTRNIAFDYS